MNIDHVVLRLNRAIAVLTAAKLDAQDMADPDSIINKKLLADEFFENLFEAQVAITKATSAMARAIAEEEG